MTGFDADLARMNAALVELGAVVTTDDGFTYLDVALVPRELLSAYERLTAYGYANGLI